MDTLGLSSILMLLVSQYNTHTGIRLEGSAYRKVFFSAFVIFMIVSVFHLVFIPQTIAENISTKRYMLVFFFMLFMGIWSIIFGIWMGNRLSKMGEKSVYKSSSKAFIVYTLKDKIIANKVIDLLKEYNIDSYLDTTSDESNGKIHIMLVNEIDSCKALELINSIIDTKIGE
jgi:hypothetical protein